MEFTSNSVNDTLRIGRRIAKELKPSDIVCLFGDLGTGKTVLTKGIACGLGINSSAITSPSFVLLRQYPKVKLPLFHFDLYRLVETKDIAGLGFEEYFYGPGVSVIEWAQRLDCLMPKDYLKIELSVKGPSRRGFKFYAFGDRYKELLKKIHEDLSH